MASAAALKASMSAGVPTLIARRALGDALDQAGQHLAGADLDERVTPCGAMKATLSRQRTVPVTCATRLRGSRPGRSTARGA